MKKYLLTVTAFAMIISFMSCGSTPTAEPEVDVAPAVVEEPPKEEEPQPEVVPEVPAEDFSEQNKALLEKAEKARQEAIDADAQTYYPDLFAATDTYYAEVKDGVEKEPSKDHSDRIEDVIAKFNSLAKASEARKMKERADELGFSDADAEKALADYDTVSQNGVGKDMLDQAEKALAAYSALFLQNMTRLAQTERAAALDAKKQADSVKAGVAKKAEYTAASDTFKKADSSYVTKDIEGAYKGYKSAKETFLKLYETVSANRAAAQAAIERAKKRVAEAETYSVEADSIAPLEGEVAGIEKEDAVLLEEDNFANPDDAVIDVESSEDAKTAAALDEQATEAAPVAEGEAK